MKSEKKAKTINTEDSRKDSYSPTLVNLPEAHPGYRIRFYRLRAGKTQKELADQCGFNESTIRNYELGNRTPKNDVLDKIADALDVDPHALYDPSFTELIGSLHILFHMSTLYSIQPQIIDGQIHLVLPEIDPGIPYGSLFAATISAWEKEYRKYLNGEISFDELFDWESRYPTKIKKEIQY